MNKTDKYTFWNFRESELYKELQDKLTPPSQIATWGSQDTVSHILSQGMFYETHTLLEFYEDLPKEGLILDIGANIGNHQMMFQQLWPNRPVFGFEGSPLNYGLLYENTAKYNNTSNLCVCLGETQGITEIVHYPDNMGGSGVRGVAKRQDGVNNIPVFVQPLDTINFNTSITIMKIDVEHFELQVLRGSVKTIEKHKPTIWIEDFNHDKDYNSSAVKYLQDSFGYKLIKRNEDNFLLECK